jgi:hypothetical protein
MCGARAGYDTLAGVKKQAVNGWIAGMNAQAMTAALIAVLLSPAAPLLHKYKPVLQCSMERVKYFGIEI